MTTALIVLLGVIGLLVLFGIFMWATYNSLVKLKIRVDEAWSDITVQLKRRTDLIPNLVGTVKGYAAHEKEVFENVAEARSAIMNAQGVQETAAAENMIEGALKSLFAVAEAYPELKANQNFIQLQQELVDTEDKIQAARRFYNVCATSTPALPCSRPTSWLACWASRLASFSRSKTAPASKTQYRCSSRLSCTITKPLSMEGGFYCFATV